MRVEEIIRLIPEAVLDKLALETKVDRHVKKLTGKSLFQLFLFSFVQSERISLRVMEAFYQQEYFKSLSGIKGKTKHSSLSDRLCTINADYFKEILNYIIGRLDDVKPGKQRVKRILRFDSTLITLTSKLLSAGFAVNGSDKQAIKFTVAYDGLPKGLKIFDDRSYASEDLALKEAIFECSDRKKGIIVFDRGLASRRAFSQMEAESLQFITRLNDKVRFREVKANNLVDQEKHPAIRIEKDSEVQLAAKGIGWLPETFRLVIAHSSSKQQTLYFLTNIRNLAANEIAEIYKKRWDIEVFFRFIKQELNAKHFLSRNLNGIKVTLYMVMILATMLLIYKSSNALSGYKLVKLRFRQELEMEIVKEIVIYCGGDPQKMVRRWQEQEN